MVTQQIATGPLLEDTMVEGLRERFHGELLRPGDDGYETARKVWNGMIDKHPALIARCTGIAGLTLGGGFGWLMHKHGLACDNLLSVDVVAADGRILTASATENADLFWGLRGGGGNFGVVTSFEYRLHPVGPVLGGVLKFPLAKAREVRRFYREYTRAAPDELTSTVALTVSPEGEPVVAAIVCYCGALDAGEEIIRPLREVSPPVADFVGPTAYTELQTIFDEEFPFGIQTYWKANYLRRLSDEAIDTLLAHFVTALSPTCQLFVEHLGGAVSRVLADATAFAHRDAPFDLVIVATWGEGEAAAGHIAWVRDCWAAMEPFTTGGVYVNCLGEEETERVSAAYRAAMFERLATVKQTYDPMNLFRRNQNIPPAR